MTAERGKRLNVLCTGRVDLDRLDNASIHKARSAATLEADVKKILAGFGSDDRMTFC